MKFVDPRLVGRTAKNFGSVTKVTYGLSGNNLQLARQFSQEVAKRAASVSRGKVLTLSTASTAASVPAVSFAQTLAIVKGVAYLAAVSALTEVGLATMAAAGEMSTATLSAAEAGVTSAQSSLKLAEAKLKKALENKEKKKQRKKNDESAAVKQGLQRTKETAIPVQGTENNPFTTPQTFYITLTIDIWTRGIFSERETRGFTESGLAIKVIEVFPAIKAFCYAFLQLDGTWAHTGNSGFWWYDPSSTYYMQQRFVSAIISVAGKTYQGQPEIPTQTVEKNYQTGDGYAPAFNSPNLKFTPSVLSKKFSKHSPRTKQIPLKEKEKKDPIPLKAVPVRTRPDLPGPNRENEVPRENEKKIPLIPSRIFTPSRDPEKTRETGREEVLTPQIPAVPLIPPQPTITITPDYDKLRRRDPTIPLLPPSQEPPLIPSKITPPSVNITPETIDEIAVKVKQKTNCERNPDQQNNDCPTVGDVFDLLKNFIENNTSPCDDIAFESLQVNYKICDNEGKHKTQTELVQIPANSTGSLASFTTALFKAISSLHDCPNDAILALPEWYPVKPGSDCPQAAVLLKAGKSYWTFHIPHYNQPKSFKPVLPKFIKGNFYANLILKDQSRVLIYAKNRTEAEKVINAVIPLINPSQLTNPPEITYGEKVGKRLAEKEVTPVRVMYYPTGLKDTKPEWIIYLDDNE